MSGKMSRRDAIRALGAVGAIGVAGCTGGESSPTETLEPTGDGDDGGGDGGDGGPTTTASGDSGGAETVEAAWLYNTQVGDLGWTWSHDQAREAVADRFDWLETDFTESLDAEDVERVCQQYANDDFDVVYGTSFGFMDPMYEVAKDNPDTIFEHCAGFKQRENMGRYFGRLYQSYYLTGIAAGAVTETDTLGFIGAYAIPEVLRFVNAFTLGAASVTDEVSTKVRWTNAWFDPPKAKQAANTLVESGADVIGTVMDSPASVKAAADSGVWATGAWAPMKEIGGQNYLTTPIWHWDVFYSSALESVRDGSWESNFDWPGLESGIVGLDEWGPEVPTDVQDQVAAKREAIRNGDSSVWSGSKFEGESDTFLFQEMASYVPQVEGEVP